MSTQPASGRAERSQRRMLQLIFIFINLALVEIHFPGPLWVAVGGLFWVAMVLLAAFGGSWMCGWMCWIGGIQDIMEPLARSRIRLNAAWGRGMTLVVLLAWVPVTWLLVPTARTAVYTPFNADPGGWMQHLFQFGLMLLVGASVMVFGKRGICRYFCPFNSVVAGVRRVLPYRRQASAVAPCASSCHSCTGCQTKAVIPVGSSVTIPLVAEWKKDINTMEME